MDQADTASILVERPCCFHRTRIAVQGKGFHVRMDLPPLRKCAAHTALARNIEAAGELAHVVENEQAAGRERRISKIELGQRGLVFVRTVENDQFGIVSEIFSRRFG